MKLTAFTAATLLVLATLRCHFATALPASVTQLKDKYRFSANLDGEGLYDLFWNFDFAAEEISFAVRVSTTGWVGFGLSPNGQMPGSDVVIGWVDDSGTDRYAEGRFLPPVDASQDWQLLSGSEDNGETILEFTRKFITCDERDLDIKPETAHVVWSWHSEDPTAPDLIPQHQFQGSLSLNLLGGLNEDRQIPPDTETFTINFENVTVPHDVDTTYWCAGYQLPEEIRQTETYVYKFAPFIADESKRFAHHILIYLCDTFNPADLDIGGPCDDAVFSVLQCRVTSPLLAAWGIGGEDFVYPDGVALPVGGPNNQQYVVLEMHYDNPKLVKGFIDSSGIEFFTTRTPPENLAGFLTVANRVRPDVIIPPNAENYVSSAACTTACTNEFIPSEGINIFGNILHTHLLGRALIVHHLRETEECGGLSELPPIDFNLNYNFNFQQANILPQETKVLPGDILLLECFYRSEGTSRTEATLGGEGTQQEMCFSFLFYYPRIDLNFCASSLVPTTFNSFVNNHIPSSQHQNFYQGLTAEPVTNQRNESLQLVATALAGVDWTQETIQELQDTINSGNHTLFCGSNEGIAIEVAPIPKIDCPYQKPDSCPTEGAHTTVASIILIAVTAILSIMYV